MDITEASASIAGYGFQFERALYRIFHSTHRNALFGIETADDVAEIIPLDQGTLAILEQDKHTRIEKNPIQDSSRNLWNSLKNWLEKLENLKKDHDRILFLLVTNGKAPNSALAKKLSDASTSKEINDAINLLKIQAKKVGDSVKDIATKVISYDKESLSYIISNFELIQELDPKALKEETYAALQIPSHLEEQKDLILENLIGRLFLDCLDFWRRKEPFWTTSDPYFTRKQLLFEHYSSSDWLARSQENSEYQELLNNNKDIILPFMTQLRELGIMERTIEKEIGHYWASYAERSRLLKAGKVLEQDLDSLEEKLFKQWDGIREHYSNQNEIPFESFLKEHHKAIYLKILPPANCDLSIGRVKSTHPYFYHGTLHHQANDDGTKHPIYWII